MFFTDVTYLQLTYMYCVRQSNRSPVTVAIMPRTKGNELKDFFPVVNTMHREMYVHYNTRVFWSAMISYIMNPVGSFKIPYYKTDFCSHRCGEFSPYINESFKAYNPPPPPQLHRPQDKDAGQATLDRPLEEQLM